MLAKAAFVDAVHRPKEEWTITHEACPVKMPWKCGYLQDVSDGCVINDDMRASKALEGMAAWSLDILMEIKQHAPTVQKAARLERWSLLCLTPSRQLRSPRHSSHVHGMSLDA